MDALEKPGLFLLCKIENPIILTHNRATTTRELEVVQALWGRGQARISKQL